MIPYSQAKEELEKIVDLTPESMVEFEEDMSDGFIIVKIPVFWGWNYIGYRNEDDESEES